METSYANNTMFYNVLYQSEPEPEQQQQQQQFFYTQAPPTPPLMNNDMFYYDESLFYYPPNVLQDDNFSIVTASELIDASPSYTQLTPYSTPSPLTMNNALFYDTSFLQQQELFAPVPIDTTIAIPSPKSKTRKSSTESVKDSEKQHICPVCSHRSKRRHNLVEHMLTHNPHRPKTFKCSHCTRPFARKYDMKRHEKIHTRCV